MRVPSALALLLVALPLGAQSVEGDWTLCEGLVGDGVISGLLAPIDPEFNGRVHAVSLRHLKPGGGKSCWWNWPDADQTSGTFGFYSLPEGRYEIWVSAFRAEMSRDTISLGDGEHRELTLFFASQNLFEDCLEEPRCRVASTSFEAQRLRPGQQEADLVRAGIRLAGLMVLRSPARSIGTICVDAPDAEFRAELVVLSPRVIEDDECELRQGRLRDLATGGFATSLGVERSFRRSDGSFVVDLWVSSGIQMSEGYRCVLKDQSGWLVPSDCWMTLIT